MRLLRVGDNVSFHHLSFDVLLAIAELMPTAAAAAGEMLLPPSRFFVPSSDLNSTFLCSFFICGPSSPPYRPSSRVSYLPSPSSSSSHASPRHLQIQRQRCRDAGSGWRCGWEEMHCYGDFSFPFVSTCPARRMKGNWFCCLQCVAASFLVSLFHHGLPCVLYVDNERAHSTVRT